MSVCRYFVARLDVYVNNIYNIVFEAQMVAWLLPMPDVHNSNPVVRKY